MAQVGNQNDIITELTVQEDRVQQKKILTENPNWEPAGGDEGAGFIPEKIWKSQYSNNSQESTEV